MVVRIIIIIVITIGGGMKILKNDIRELFIFDFRSLFKARFPSLFRIFLITLPNLEYCVEFAKPNLHVGE